MIDKIKDIYPNYLIFIKRNGKIFNLNNEEVTSFSDFDKKSYVLIHKNSYEVHKKISNKKRKTYE